MIEKSFVFAIIFLLWNIHQILSLLICEFEIKLLYHTNLFLSFFRKILCATWDAHYLPCMRMKHPLSLEPQRYTSVYSDTEDRKKVDPDSCFPFCFSVKIWRKESGAGWVRPSAGKFRMWLKQVSSLASTLAVPIPTPQPSYHHHHIYPFRFFFYSPTSYLLLFISRPTPRSQISRFSQTRYTTRYYNIILTMEPYPTGTNKSKFPSRYSFVCFTDHFLSIFRQDRLRGNGDSHGRSAHSILQQPQGWF